MQKQRLKQSLGFNLSPQQIQFLSLLQIPILSLDARIDDEIEDNPALEIEENEEDSSQIDEYDYRYRSYNNTKDYDPNISESESLQDYLKKQLLILNLDDRFLFLTKYLIDSLDDNGWLTIDLFAVLDDLMANLNLDFSEIEIRKALNIIHTLEPYGVGALNLKDCLLIQLENKKKTKTVDLAIDILQNNYDDFTKKNFEEIIRKQSISESELKEVYLLIEKLNPFPSSNFIQTSKRTEYVFPDFSIKIENEHHIVTLNKLNSKELRVSNYYQKMISETNDIEAKKFLKQKIDSAKWFINAISQREETLIKVMKAIVHFQEKYFFTSEEKHLKPMKLLDIAKLVEMDISTISRVTNSKYVETFFGTFLLKDFFSEAYRKDNGQEVSTQLIKDQMKEIINNEDKKNPFTDEKLATLLAKNEYQISRRTVAKYREDLKILSSKYRREL